MINFNKGVSTPVALTIIIVLAVIVVGGIFAYQYYYLPKQETEIPKVEIPKNETAGWKTYRNEGYGFEIKYPTNWGISNSIMEWLINNDYSYRIIFTNLSATEENDYIKALNDYMGIGGAYEHVNNYYGRIIEITPTTYTIEIYKNPEPEVGWEISNFREETKAGLKIFRFIETITWEMGLDLDSAMIPYSGDKTLNGKKINYIRLNIDRNKDSYEKDIFEKMLSTFKFID